MKKIRILWDIDGTLLTTNGAGAPGMKLAIGNILGRDVEFDLKRNSGKTDFEIIQSYLEESELDTEINIERAVDEYVKLLEAALSVNPATRLANIKESLDILEKRTDISSEICTGNVYEGAKLKLTSAGLWDYFKKSKFWTPSVKMPTRKEVVRSSIFNTGDERVLIIGDSPADLYAARDFKIDVLLIPSGHHSKTELDLGASFLFDRDWMPTDLENVINKILAD